MRSSALWLVGFRPFFALACLAGVAFPLFWAQIFSGAMNLPDLPVAPIVWHAHEMLFGFGWAVLGGFLLTSTKNWVGIRGYHGGALIWLVAAWCTERLAMLFGGAWPEAFFLAGANLFLGSIVAMLLWTLIRHRQTDSYRDNVFFMVMLPTFIAAKQLLLFGDFNAGYTVALALFRLAFLVMLERTLTQFMKGLFQVQILRTPKLDLPIKALALTLVAEPAIPGGLLAAIALTLAALLALRFLFWKPQLAFRRIDIGIMYIGYLAILGQLLITAASQLTATTWIGTVGVHLFTFGAMGCVIPAMIVRISKGHTGRKVIFETADRAVLYVMLAALAIRVGIPQWLPDTYLAVVHAAAICWALGFGTLAIRYIPMLAQPRIDGREH